MVDCEAILENDRRERDGEGDGEADAGVTVENGDTEGDGRDTVREPLAESQIVPDRVLVAVPVLDGVRDPLFVADSVTLCDRVRVSLCDADASVRDAVPVADAVHVETAVRDRERDARVRLKVRLWDRENVPRVADVVTVSVSEVLPDSVDERGCVADGEDDPVPEDDAVATPGVGVRVLVNVSSVMLVTGLIDSLLDRVWECLDLLLVRIRVAVKTEELRLRVADVVSVADLPPFEGVSVREKDFHCVFPERLEESDVELEVETDADTPGTVAVLEKVAAVRVLETVRGGPVAEAVPALDVLLLDFDVERVCADENVRLTVASFAVLVSEAEAEKLRETFLEPVSVSAPEAESERLSESEADRAGPLNEALLDAVTDFEAVCFSPLCDRLSEPVVVDDALVAVVLCVDVGVVDGAPAVIVLETVADNVWEPVCGILDLVAVAEEDQVLDSFAAVALAVICSVHLDTDNDPVLVPLLSQ